MILHWFRLPRRRRTHERRLDCWLTRIYGPHLWPVAQQPERQITSGQWSTYEVIAMLKEIRN